MNPADSASHWLSMEDHLTTLWPGDSSGPVVVEIGARDIAEGVFRHDPPRPHEMEQAIDRVEDALAASGLRRAVHGDLLSADPRLHALLGLRAEGERVSRDEVEARFQRLASVSLGHPGGGEGLPADNTEAAALLILRECLHHLGYEGLRRAAAA